VPEVTLDSLLDLLFLVLDLLQRGMDLVFRLDLKVRRVVELHRASAGDDEEKRPARHRIPQCAAAWRPGTFCSRRMIASP